MTGQRSRRGRSAREAEANRLAWVEHRRILVDELVQHPDVWEYIAEQAREVAELLPDEEDDARRLMWDLADVSEAVAAILKRAQAADEQAAS